MTRDEAFEAVFQAAQDWLEELGDYIIPGCQGVDDDGFRVQQRRLVEALAFLDAGKVDRDSIALNELAQILRRPEWPSGADFLDRCAFLVRETGRDIVNGIDDLGVRRGEEQDG